MSEPENLVLQQLREIRATLDQLTQTVSGILTRLTGIEQLLITLYGMQNEGEQRDQRIAERVIRLEARVDRLEKAAEVRP